MERLIRRDAEFQRLYNCSFYDVEQIPLGARRNIPLGVAEIFVGTIELLLYLPCMISIWWHRQHSCYRLMFVMGVLDCAKLAIDGPLTGAFTIAGLVFCSAPNTIYVLGALQMGLYAAEQVAELALALNRCLFFAAPRMALWLFPDSEDIGSEQQKKTTKWTQWLLPVLAPVGYGTAYALFGQPCLFTAFLQMWAWSPHLGYADSMASEYIHVHWYTANAAIVLIALPTVYMVFAVCVWKQQNRHHCNRSTTVDGAEEDDEKKQFHTDVKPIFKQVALISTVNCAACALFFGVHLVTNYRTMPVYATFMLWCFMQVHGLPPIVYLAFNKRIKRDCKKLLKKMGILSSAKKKKSLTKRIASSLGANKTSESTTMEVLETSFVHSTSINR